jgi:hypothetical protein
MAYSEWSKLHASVKGPFCVANGKILADDDASEATHTAEDFALAPMKLADFKALSPNDRTNFRHFGGEVIE